MPELLTDTIKKTIGKKIKNCRKESGLTLRDLAAISEIGHSWIAKLEKGQINFRIESLIRLIEILQLQPRELFPSDVPYDDGMGNF
ncbi:MAG TPA: helix-turn-helix domain-containing protein [Chitinophagaceae bacterium]|jgi:transcriptional regulator with XRE-family HTH domain|nr:helix-turn-helix domain-containing protein [Chitinophagaceae bacterium]